MNYVKQLNAFGQKSAGNLDAKEQALYLRLFLICNQLRRPEWFAVSNVQLMRELSIGSEHTVIRIRSSLKKKGFIDFQSTGKGKMMAYHLPLLYAQTPAKNAVVDENTPAKNADIYKDIKEKDISTTSRKGETEIDDDFKTVIKTYEDNIRPAISPLEFEKLADDVEHFGKDAVIKAIERADYRNKRSLGYIEAILKRWETEGYDDPDERSKKYGARENGQGLNGTRKQMRYDAQADARKWEHETSGWD